MAVEFLNRWRPRAGLLLLALLFGVAGCQPLPTEPPETLEVRIAGRTYHLELALDAASRYQGLSDRLSIDPQGGMLFVFPDSAVRSFVMRRCHVPIDLLYLDANGRLIRTHAMTVEPPETWHNPVRSYGSRHPAQFVIELAGGQLPDLGLQPGDQIVLPLEQLKAWTRQADEASDRRPAGS